MNKLMMNRELSQNKPKIVKPNACQCAKAKFYQV